MPVYDILCLANSRKPGGSCIAGLRADGKGWIRLVSHKPNGVLIKKQSVLQDGSPPQLLDLLRIRCANANPEPHHPENYYITHSPWKLLARPAPASTAELLRSALTFGPILLRDTNDRLPYRTIESRPMAESLSLVAPNGLKWIIEPNHLGERKTRVSFTLKGVQYKLSVTDPIWEERLEHLPTGIHLRQAARLTEDDLILLSISLGEPFPRDNAELCCFKLVAGVIVLPPSWRKALQGSVPQTFAMETRVPAEENYDWSWLQNASGER